MAMVAMRVALLTALLDFSAISCGGNAQQAVAEAVAEKAAAAPPLELSLVGEKSLRTRLRMLREGNKVHGRQEIEGTTRRNQTDGLLRMGQRRLQDRPAEEIEEATLYGNTEPLGYFYAEVAIGTPEPQRFHLVVDTRSSLTTVPCAGCTRCGSHTNTFFDPDQSTSYSAGCSAVPGCGSVGTHSSCAADDHCTYSITRRDGSAIAGELARDHVGMVYANTMVLSTFGCQSSETGQLHAQLADGVLGLGLSEHSSHLTVVDSYVAQHGLRDTLTFCLSQTGGTLAFGADPPAVHTGYFSTPLTPNGKYYSVQIREISLGATPLGIASSSYSTGGGVIFDARAPVNYWPREVYQRLSAVFAAETAGMGLGVPVQWRGADCWPVERAPDGIASFPTITVRFAGAAAQQLHAVHYMFEHNLAWYASDADPQDPQGAATHYCNGNFDHSSSRVVLGSLFMRHLRITFERVEQMVYMHEDECGDDTFSTDNDSCDLANNRYCDEPYTCATGTDKTDCDELELGGNPYCQYTDDGECDEIAYCPRGSDTHDCCASGTARATDPSGREVVAEQVCCGTCDLPGDDWCQYARDGVCDEPMLGTGECPRTSDASDCNSVQPSCPYTGDGECDEGSYCAAGTDTADCCDGAEVRICISEWYCTPGQPVSDSAICGQASPPPPSIPDGADPDDICANSDLVLDWSNGFHVSGHATFGAQVLHAPDYRDVEIAVARPELACSTLESNVAGKIALIRRGECYFYQKALNAQGAGALAAVIYNHSPGLVTMLGSGMSSVDDSIHIPSIFIDMTEGIELRVAAMAGPTTATLHCQAAPLCPTARDDHCDEPYACLPGTDTRDCAEAGYSRGGNPFCPYTNDRECDEVAYCPAGSDTMDCCDAGVPRETDLSHRTIDPSDVCCTGDCPAPASNYCRWSNDGECDEPPIGYACPVGSDTVDCDAVRQAPCRYADDSECDEGMYCLPGTDFNDCCGSVGVVKPGVPNTENAECSEAAARIAGMPRAPGPDSCWWANDRECDEPSICPYGTDTTDCSTNLELEPEPAAFDGGPCDEVTWPDVDSNADTSGICGECKVLVHFGTGESAKYEGKCSNYCAAVGAATSMPMRCVGAWEDMPGADSCNVSHDETCGEAMHDPTGAETTDGICECRLVDPASPAVQANAALHEVVPREAPEDTSCRLLCTLPVVLIAGVCCLLACKRYNLRPVALVQAKLTASQTDNIYLSTASDDTADETASLTSAGRTDYNPLQPPDSTSHVHQYRATGGATSTNTGGARADSSAVAISAPVPAPSKAPARVGMKPQAQVESILAGAAASVGVTEQRPTPEPEPAPAPAPTIGTTPAAKTAARAAARATAKAVTAKAVAAAPAPPTPAAAEEVMFWSAMDPTAVAAALQGPAAAPQPTPGVSSALQSPTTTSSPERPTAL